MITTLYILCGLPGSGKSTWIDKYLKETGFGILKPSPFVRVVSRDEVRFSMINTEAAENNDKEYFSREKEVYDEFINRIVEGIEDPYCGIVFADATHISVGSRYKLYQAIARKTKEEYNVVLIWFDVPVEVCKQRNAQREGVARVPDRAIDNMRKHFEFPTLEHKNLVEIKIVRD